MNSTADIGLGTTQAYSACRVFSASPRSFTRLYCPAGLGLFQTLPVMLVQDPTVTRCVINQTDSPDRLSPLDSDS